jgi:hypothetical protein
LLVPEEVVRGVVMLPSITPVEGLLPPAAGVGLANGEVVVVLCLDRAVLSPSCRDERTIAVSCNVLGNHVALVGGTVVAAGLFELEGEGRVRFGDELADIADVMALYSEAEGALWADRTNFGEVSP